MAKTKPIAVLRPIDESDLLGALRVIKRTFGNEQVTVISVIRNGEDPAHELARWASVPLFDDDPEE
jgi:hypothetical protein